MNFRHWPQLIEAARKIGLDQVSFLPADVSSHAFNREVLWSDKKQHEILISQEELPELLEIIENILSRYQKEIETGFIAESREKLLTIYRYYAAFYGLNPFPYKRCNAPWVSTVIEPDGTVRHCFFHGSPGNMRETPLEDLLNSPEGIRFRKNLDINTDETCVKCVCYLYLSPLAKLK
jgi:sulfatase maturation enzyme AslB (radical SAM superfamily)